MQRKLFDTGILEPKKTIRLFVTQYLFPERNGMWQNRLERDKRFGAMSLEVNFWPPLGEESQVIVRIALANGSFKRNFSAVARIANEPLDMMFRGDEQVVVDVSATNLSEKHLVSVIVHGTEI